MNYALETPESDSKRPCEVIFDCEPPEPKTGNFWLGLTTALNIKYIPTPLIDFIL